MITKPIKRRQEVLRTSTIRDFSGGWNVIDNDLNLTTKYAKVLSNMLRLSDGSIGIRPGTRLFSKIDTDVGNVAVALSTDAITYTNTETDVSVSQTAHGYLPGHTVTMAGATDAHGILGSKVNGDRVITEVTDADNYKFETDGTATSTGTGGGASITSLDHNDNHKLTGNIINIQYFSNHIVVVTSTGQVGKLDSLGNTTLIWSDNLAVNGSALSGVTEGWNTTDFCSFAVFNGELIICNGVDKPLIVNFSNTANCDFLHDLAGVSNTNTPVCRYVVAMNNYLVMAGDPVNTDRVHISNYQTSGTWNGDAAPNDGINVDLGSVVTSDSQIIKGIGRFRSNLVVAFEDVTILGELEIYDDTTGDHEPDFDDQIEGSGTVAHRAMQALRNDFLLNDSIGVPSLQRAKLTATIQPQRVSELIDPEIQKAISLLTTATLEDNIFSVYDKNESRYLLFIPNGNTPEITTETVGYSFTLNESLRIKSWARIKGWNWSCACRSSLGRIFYAKNNAIYVQGSKHDPITADFVDDTVKNADGTGIGIAFDWELPWADFDKRMHQKVSKYLGIDSKGTAEFNVQMFIDNLYENKQTGNKTPNLDINFVGGDAPGYGDEDEQDYGGGRRTADERLWDWPSKFKIMKLRVYGVTKKALSIISISLAYHEGSIRR